MHKNKKKPSQQHDLLVCQPNAAENSRPCPAFGEMLPPPLQKPSGHPEPVSWLLIVLLFAELILHLI